MSVESLDSKQHTGYPMAQHSQNSTIIVADIHMGIDTQNVHTAVDQEDVCSVRHTIYHNKHIH